MNFNVNEYVKVKLTQAGLYELKRQHEELKASFPKLDDWKEPEADDQGYVKYQLWSLMSRL